MPRFTPLVSLDNALSNLMRQRQEHQEALAEIDAVFARYGITPNNAPPAPRRGRPPGSGTTGGTGEPTVRRRGRRRKFGQTADEFVQSLLADGNSKSGREINVAWRDSGRKGTADNTLSLLFKKKGVKRVPAKEGRGSIYSAA